MSTLRKRCLALLIMLGVVAGLPLFLSRSVYASTNPVISLTDPPKGDISKLETLVSNINSDIDEHFKYTSDDKANNYEISKYFVKLDTSDYDQASKQGVVTLEINMLGYKELTQAGKQNAMQITLQDVENSSVSRATRVKIYNFIAEEDSSTSSLVRQLSTDVDADFADAYSSFKPFSGVLGWILGILTLGIFMLLGLTIVIDIAYIVLPGVQCALAKPSEGKKPNYISLEAFNAVKEAESSAGKEYKNPLNIYLKSKVKQFICLGICILYLVSGKIYIFIANIMDYIEAIIGA